MAGGVIAEAFVELVSDNKGFEADLAKQVEHPIEGVADVTKRTSEQIQDQFRLTTEDMARRFGMGAEESRRALDILNSESFVELRAAVARAGESVQEAMGENARQAGSDLERLDSRSFAELRGESERTGEKIERDFREASRSADRSIDGLNVSARGHFGAIGLYAGGAAAAILAIGGLAVKQGVETAGGLEMSEVAFQGVLGSADAARTEMQKLTDFAAKTPFELPGLLTADAKLLAVHDALGITQDGVLPLIGTLGDLASVLGQGQPQVDAAITALSQIGSNGRLSAQDVGQLVNAFPGFNAWKVIADGMGLSVAQVRQMAEQGKLTGEQALPILIQGMKDFPGAAGAMERASLTLTGQLSTFKDTANIALAQGLGPLVEGLKEQLPAITAGLAPLFGSIGVVASAVFAQLGPLVAQGLGPLGQIVTSLAGPLSGVVQVIGSIATALGPGVVAVFQSLGQALSLLAPPLAAIGGQIGQTLSNVLQIIAPLLPPIAAAFAQILTAVTPLLAPLGRLVEMLASTLAPILVTLVQNAADAVSTLMDGLGPAFNSVLDALQPLLPMLAELFAAFSDPATTKELAKSLGELAKSVAEILVAVLPLLEPLIKLNTWVISMQTAATGKVIQFFTFLVGKLAELLSWVAKVIPPLDKFKDWFRTFGAQVVGVWDTTWGAVTDAVVTALDAVIGAGRSVVRFFQSVWSGVQDFIIEPIRAAFDFIRPVIEGFITFVKVDLAVVATLLAAPFVIGLTAIRAAVDTLWPPIRAVFDVAVSFFQAEWALIDGYLVQPIQSALGTLVTVVTTGWALVQAVFDTAITWVTTVWATINQLLVQPIQAGLDAAFNAATTVWATVQAVFQTGLDWVTTTWSTISGLLSGPVDTGINAASTAISTVWATAQGILNTAITWVTETWATVEGLISGPVTRAASAITTAVSALWEGPVGIKTILNSIIGGFDAVISAWNGLEFTLPEIQLPSFGGLDVGGVTVIPGWEGPTLPSVTVGTPNIPSIPKLAEGGLITREGLAFLHPAEVVTPIDKGAAAARRSGFNMGGGVTFNGPVTFGSDAASAVAELDWFARFRMGKR